MIAVIRGSIIFFKKFIRENDLSFKVFVSRVESRIYNSNIDIAEIFVVIPSLIDICRLYPPV